MSCFVGVDLGGTVVKAAVFALDGREMGNAGYRTPLRSDTTGAAERTIEEIGGLMCDAIRDALTAAGVSGADVGGIATTGHGKGLYTLDKDGSLGMGIVSTDTRSREVANRINADDQVRTRLYSRILQPLWPAHPLSILIWLKESRPEVYHRIGTILMAKDLLRYLLTGEAASEYTDLSGTALWNNVRQELDADILREMGIPEVERMIPPVLAAHDRAGSVTDAIAARTGLIAGTPVFGGLFDVNACVVATGLTDEREIGAVVGTWSISTLITDNLDPMLSSSHPYVIGAHIHPGQWLIHEASPTSASNLEWFTQAMLTEIPEKERLAYCNAAVAQTHETGVTFFPFLFGDDLGANASGTFWGIRPGTSRAEVIRGIYEGIAFQHMRHLAHVLAVQPTPERVRFAGGATRSDVWMQLFADLIGIPVAVSPAEELGAMGAAICAAVGSGAFPGYPEAIAAMTGIRRIFEPNPEQTALLQNKQRRFADAVHAMEPIWRSHD